MKRRLAWTPLFALLGSLPLGCFSRGYDCRLLCATTGDECPTGYECVQGAGSRVCRPQGSTACGTPVTPDRGDAAHDNGGDDVSALEGGSPPMAVDADSPSQDSASASDAESPPSDASDGAEDIGQDAPEAGDGGGGTPVDLPPPSGLAPEQLCYPADNCVALSPAFRSGLALLLDPTSLPIAGTPVLAWPDRSGRGNHAAARNSNAPPISAVGGVTLKGFSSLEVRHHESLDLGDDDFAVYIVARVDASGPPACFVAKNNGPGPESRRLWIAWGLTRNNDLRPQVFLNGNNIEAQTRFAIGDLSNHLLSVVRLGRQVHLRVDGDLATPPVTLKDGTPPVNVPAPMLIGSCTGTTNIAFMSTVILVRGQIPEDERLGIEALLMKGFNIPR